METLLTAIEAHPWLAFWLAFFCVVALWAVFGGAAAFIAVGLAGWMLWCWGER